MTSQISNVNETDQPEENETKNEETSKVVIAGYECPKDYFATGFKIIIDGLKASQSMPTGNKYNFYKNFTNFRGTMKDKIVTVQTMLEDLLEVERVKGCVRNAMLQDGIDSVIAFNDTLLDRAGKFMDVIEGVKTSYSLCNQTDISGSWNRMKPIKKNDSLSLSIQKNIPRPQFTFKDRIDNSNVAWIPKIKDKPNSLKPLSILPEMTEDGEECYSHPYEYELELWSVPEKQLKKQKPVVPKPLEEDALVFVDTEEGLSRLMDDLVKQDIIAVDLEHHSYRTFLGFTCLIQLSTPTADYVIDSLALRHNLHILNEVFTKPSIIKVFHGADSDIIWLQRDFNVYVVNMFDTHQACKLLNFPRLSLAFLLNHYCSVDADKQFQLFDWRIRPVPEKALAYARQDTHYLIYLYQMLTNQLIDNANGETNLLEVTYQRSKLVCLKRYTRPIVDEESYMLVYRKSKRLFDNRQLHALKGLYLWRDKTAREADESTGYVLPDHMMLHIAENLPREAQGVLACCNPIPPLVRANLIELHYIIVRAKEQPLVKVIPEGNPVPISTTNDLMSSEEKKIWDKWIYSELPDEELPTLLDGSLKHDDDSDELTVTPELTLFVESEKIETEEKNEQELNNISNTIQFESPYQRFLKVLPFIVELEKQEKQKEEEEAERQREESRKKLALAMQIQSLEDTGVIKLQKTEKDQEPLKIQMRNEKINVKKIRKFEGKRKNVSKNNDNEEMKRRKILELDEIDEGFVKDDDDNIGLGGKEVKKEDDLERRVGEGRGEGRGRGRSRGRAKNWKDFKKMKKGNGDGWNQSFDYSKVDYSRFQNKNKRQSSPHYQTGSNFRGKRKESFGNNRNFASKKRRGKWV